MEIIQHPGDFHWHPDHVMLIDHVKHMLAANYTSLLSHIDSHIDNRDIHVSVEDRDRWDNKADKVSLYDLEMRLANKADRVDLIELQEAIAKIKSGTDSTDGTNNTSYVTEREIQYILQGKDYVTTADLSDYATKQWCEDTFLKKSDYNPGNVSQDTINYINQTIQEAVDAKDITGYDDSEIRTLITNVDSKIDDFIAQDDANVRSIIEGILNQWDWISKLPAGIIKYPMEWNDTLEAFIQYVINKDADGNGGTWSSIVQKYNEIKNEVDSLRINTDETGKISIETLASIISNRIQDNDEGLRTSVAEMTTMWAKLNGQEALDPNDPDYLKKLRNILDNYATYDYVVSGFQSQANESGGFARQYADAMTRANDAETDISELRAVSQTLTTAKTDLESRMASAEASLTSKASMTDVNNAITTATSGLATESYVDDEVASAKSEMYAEVNDVRASISTAVENGISSITITSDQIKTAAQGADISVRSLSVETDGGNFVDIDSESSTFYNDVIADNGVQCKGSLHIGDPDSDRAGYIYVTDSEGSEHSGAAGINTFTTNDGKTITVVNGIITSIV